jgi:hypothetical protein
MSLHVAVDLDDVTVDFWPTILRRMEEEFGVDVLSGFDGDPWGDVAVATGKHRVFAEAGYRDWWDWISDRPWLWASCPPVPGAIGGIKRLRAAGHYVEAVTSKPEWAEPIVWQWLGDNCPMFNRVTVLPLAHAKADWTGADIMVDDKLATCQSFVKSGRIGIWFNRGPGGHGPTQDGLIEVRNWEEVIARVEGIDLYASTV